MSAHHPQESTDDSSAAEPFDPVARPTGVERRSVDFVPPAERHGSPRHLGAVWTVANINLTAMATGVAALALGGSLFWTLVATVSGSLFGTLFMAFHSAQGPHVGLPQLIQSRAQFGFLGAALTVFVFALMNYVNYNVADAILSGSSVESLTGVPTEVGFPLAAVAAGTLALYGYHWIHRVNRMLVVPLVLATLLLTVGALASSGISWSTFAPGDFRWAPFMTTFVMVAGFQLGWSPYVSDYSRYLPASVSTRASFWWTYLPSALSALWVIGLGAVLSAGSPGSDPIAAFERGGDNLVGGMGKVLVALFLVGLLIVMALNAYGGSLTLISIVDSFRRVNPSRTIRAVSIVTMTASVWLIAEIVGEERFNVFYGNVLVFLAYLFTPWTAINLIDFYVIRKGRYSVGDLFTPTGIYGRWGWQGNLAYLLSLLVMCPFFVTVPFTGWVAQRIGSVDISMFVGLVAASGLYWLFARTLDLSREREIVADEGLIGDRL